MPSQLFVWAGAAESILAKLPRRRQTLYLATQQKEEAKEGAIFVQLFRGHYSGDCAYAQ
jgi:hypothetical protein